MAILFEKESWAIRGAALEVHKQLGCGFSEKVYQDALEIEFKLMKIPYEREKHITINYKGHQIDHDYFADFVCYGHIIVELKAVSEIIGAHKSQVVNYLRATGSELGFLFNFGETSLKTERILNHYAKK